MSGSRRRGGWHERRVPARRALAAGDAAPDGRSRSLRRRRRIRANAAELVGIRPSTVKRHLADLRARSGLTTEQLIYRGRAEGWLVVPSLEPGIVIRVSIGGGAGGTRPSGGGREPPPDR